DRSVDVFANAVHTEQVFPARKKARVILCTPGREQLERWAEGWTGYEGVAGCGRIEALPAVFARDRMDIGSRLLLPHVVEAAGAAPAGTRVLDLACGNGVLGLAALGKRPELSVTFSDVSSQAVLSARRNTERSFTGARASFVHCDGVPEGEGPWDLILLNPPFHAGGVVGDHVALWLFRAASRGLAPGGRLLMVGNRHLGYHRSLGRFFAHVRQRDASPKFVVFEADND
ncbi:MAG: methyltransferase, partial [Pseudomonadota bacterium]|nr:methyltransferase [Pseudomonadota bacterium]